MTKSVLCAVDLSNGDIDGPVLKQAARLADLDGARLDVVTVIPDYGEGWVADFFEPQHFEQAIEAAGKSLRALCEATLGAERNKSIRHVVASGTAYKEVLKTAGEAGSDLIVIGAHKPDLKDYLLGPNASRIINHSDCSVYVLRQG